MSPPITKYDLEVATGDLKDYIRDSIDGLEEKYVLRAACKERHKTLDPKELMKTQIVGGIMLAVLTGTVTAFAMHALMG